MFDHEREIAKVFSANDALRSSEEPAHDWAAEAARDTWAPRPRITDSEKPDSQLVRKASNDAAGVLLLSISPFSTATLAFVGQLYEQDAFG